MPMLKTAPSGTTSITNVKAYLEKSQRQGHDSHAEELRLYEDGEITLSEQQVGLLQDYLGESTRALAVDVSEDLSKRNWARQMDLTRARYGHNSPTKTGRPRTYYHFILSPSMEDACTLPTLRSYAKAWVQENFRNGERLYEYAIVYHDDNERGIPHAHIVVNATNKATGKKLHLGNDEVVALGQSAQDVGRRFGLTPIHKEGEYRHVGDVRTSQLVYLTREERELLNQRKYSWKWELRKAVLAIAPLSDSFEDFRLKMNGAGYDVSRSKKTGYLTYAHRNGIKVKDSGLGSLFYMEALEKQFTHESVLADKTYSNWELIQITKGKVPWKEDIRRAIDAVAPMVMSLSDLQSGLERLYGIRMIVNRRGITYQHSSGYKTRDVSIGLRYTFDGLQQNAVLALALPYPAFQDIAEESSSLVRQYLPRYARGVAVTGADQVAAHFVYRDLARMMVRMGLVRIEDVPKALEDRQSSLRSERADLAAMRIQLMRLNRLAVLQSRCERDISYLHESQEDSDSAIYNETLLRYERTKLYLREQVGDVDARTIQAGLSADYESKLEAYRQHAESLSQDAGIYRNYLFARNVRSFSEEGEGVANASAGSAGSGLGGVDVKALFAAGQTLAKHQLRDFYHLEQMLSSLETRLDLLQFRMGKLENRRDKLGLIWADIRAFKALDSSLPSANTLEKHATELGLAEEQGAFQQLAEKLENRGIRPEDFPSFERDYREIQEDCDVLSEEVRTLQASVDELREAKDVCQAVAETVARPMQHLKDQKGTSGGGQAIAASQSASEKAEQRSSGRMGAKGSPVAEDLPLEEARRRRQERLRGAPNRSRRLQGDDLAL